MPATIASAHRASVSAAVDSGGPDMHVRVQHLCAGDDSDHPEGYAQRANGR